MNDDCVFCRIVAGALPCTRVAESAQVLAFLDISPIIKGHTLVIPKAHLDPLTAVPAELLTAVMIVVQRIGQAQLEGLGAAGFNVLQSNGACAGQEVPHVHFHVVPRFTTDGHHWNWKTVAYDHDAEREAVADRMRALTGQS